MKKPTSTYWLFTILLLALLTSPFWLVNLPNYSPKNKWLETRAAAGNYQFFAKQIYDENGDIDILVLGDSLLWAGLNTDILEAELSKKLGRKATVLHFGANWRGEELIALLLKEMLEHRHVKMVVMDMPTLMTDIKGVSEMHPAVVSWWVMGEHIPNIMNIDLVSFIKLYAASVLGTPRHLLSLLRENPLVAEDRLIRSNTRTGALVEKTGYQGNYVAIDKFPALNISAEEIVLSEKTSNIYHFTEEKLSVYRAHFLQQFFNNAEAHGCEVMITSMPRYSTSENTYAVEIADYRSIFSGKVTLASIPPSYLFDGMSKEEIRKYFYDEHMNDNGSTLFTYAILPTIFSIYEHHYSQISPSRPCCKNS